jgi:hypothetical protein
MGSEARTYRDPGRRHQGQDHDRHARGHAHRSRKCHYPSRARLSGHRSSSCGGRRTTSAGHQLRTQCRGRARGSAGPGPLRHEETRPLGGSNDRVSGSECASAHPCLSAWVTIRAPRGHDGLAVAALRGAIMVAGNPGPGWFVRARWGSALGVRAAASDATLPVTAAQDHLSQRTA